MSPKVVFFCVFLHLRAQMNQSESQKTHSRFHFEIELPRKTLAYADKPQMLISLKLVESLTIQKPRAIVGKVTEAIDS